MKTADQRKRMLEVMDSGNVILERQLIESEQWSDEELDDLVNSQHLDVFDGLLQSGKLQPASEAIDELIEKECSYYDD